MVPVRVSQEQGQIDRGGAKLLFQGESQFANSGTGVEDDDVPIGADLHASGVSAVTDRRRAGDGDRSADSPEFYARRRGINFKGARPARSQFQARAARAFYHGGELFPLQRFDEITVAPRFHDGVALDVIGAAGDDNDLYQIKSFPDRPADLKAADPGQQQIAKDHVGPSRQGKIDSGRAIFGFNNLPTVAREKAPDPFAAFRVIFNEQDRRHGASAEYCQAVSLKPRVFAA